MKMRLLRSLERLAMVKCMADSTGSHFITCDCEIFDLLG